MFSLKKWKEILADAAAWMDREDITLSEVSQLTKRQMLICRTYFSEYLQHSRSHQGLQEGAAGELGHRAAVLEEKCPRDGWAGVASGHVPRPAPLASRPPTITRRVSTLT